jgi:uncharacterized protein (UPF0332 family)
VQIVTKTDISLVMEGDKIVFSAFDSSFDETYRHEQGLYDFISENLDCYDSDEWGSLDRSSKEELESIISELEDALQYAKELLAKAD